MNFPEIEKIFEDEYLLLAFREYLYVTHSQENLSFWLEAGMVYANISFDIRLNLSRGF